MIDVYLDVDGVINALQHDHEDGWGWECEPRTFRFQNSFTITFADDLIVRLNALAENPNVRMHWLTTWLDEAPNTLCDEVGLKGKDWPVLGRRESARFGSRDWWKYLVVREHAVENPVIWIDDDLRFDQPAQEWIAAQDGGRVLGICPDTRHGLTPALMDAIETFVKEHQ